MDGPTKVFVAGVLGDELSLKNWFVLSIVLIVCLITIGIALVIKNRKRKSGYVFVGAVFAFLVAFFIMLFTLVLATVKVKVYDESQENYIESYTTEYVVIANEQDKQEEGEIVYINPDGDTLETRVSTPEGYMRIEADEGSFQTFLRNYSLKEDGSPILLYDGTEKFSQGAHVAVFKLPLENEDLQQCADSVMRMYAEYFLSTGQQDKISYHLSDGFEAKYTKWRDGYRIGIENDKAYWVKSAEYDDSYETFVKYMRMVFAYAGTASMESEVQSISLKEIRAGDVFLQGGSPGHVVMVVDVCEKEDGKKAFLLAQGYMPAQEFHLLKNPLHDDDAWYYEEEIEYPLQTPGYTFKDGSLKRLAYGM